MFTSKPLDYLKFDSPVNQTKEKIHWHNILRRFHKWISMKLLKKNWWLPSRKISTRNTKYYISCCSKSHNLLDELLRERKNILQYSRLEYVILERSRRTQYVTYTWNIRTEYGIEYALFIIVCGCLLKYTTHLSYS